MAKIFALLVGINNYPSKPLQGCINDVDAVETYLQTVYPKDSLEIKRVTDVDDDKPVRESIIKSFGHFDNAQNDDTCLFYYSGHGSFSPAPEEFWTDSSGFVQSFVCQDSRLPGGMDLMDKEMSFLIWRTMFKKPDITFVAITDCCHSGTITKNIDTTDITDRMMSANSVPARVQDYFGFKVSIDNQPAYTVSKSLITGKDKVTVAQGNHIHIAASRDNQTSKELMIDGKRRGAFTHSLLKTLYSCGGRISYKELVDKTSVLVKNLVPDQNPDVNINGLLKLEQKNKIFLSQDLAVADSRYRVYHDSQYGRWCIQAGLGHSVAEGDIVHIEKLGDTKIMASPFPDFSFIEVLAGLDSGTEYFATVTSLPDRKLKLSFAPDIPADIQSMILNRQETWKSGLFILLTDDAGRYIIRTNDNVKYFITLPGSEQPVFEPRKILVDGDVPDFFSDIETVSKWLNLQEFNNPASKLTGNDYKIKLYRSKLPGIYTEDNFEELNEIMPVNDLYYKQKDNDWKKPAFRLSITNNSSRDLWLSSAYLGFDYSINPSYFTTQQIGAGKQAWLNFIDKRGVSTDTILMQVDKEFQQLGYNEITEYLKLFISTEKIDIGYTSQEGIKLAALNTKSFEAIVTKSPGGEDDEISYSNKDWKTETIGFRIIKPLAETEISAGKSTTLQGITIEAHLNLNGKASITGSDKTSKVYEHLSNVAGFNAKTMDGIYNPGDDILPPHAANGNSYLEPFDLSLSGTRSGTVMDVLELFDVENKDVVTSDDPLIIQPPATRSVQDDYILPIGYDPDTKLYYPLGYYSPRDGKIYIEALPVETASDAAITQKSFLGSIKIYFQKVIGAKLGFSYNYPQLAVAEVSDTLKVDYKTDKKFIESEIENATDIIVFIHGIIGDTESMVKCIKTPLDAHGNTLKKDEKTKVLTFDYENLNTSILDTGKALGIALSGVGLKEGHQKNLVLVAHSMGGLVSRWYIEKCGGDKVVSKLIMLGTPNNGTPWADVRDMAETMLTYAINGATFLKPWMLVLSGVGRFIGGTQVALKEMDIKTGIYDKLNDKPSPELPYTIIAGNTQKIIVNYEGTSTLIDKLFRRIKKHGVYDALDTLLFKKPNDIAVTDDSISTLSITDGWAKKPTLHEVACDHLNYFTNLDSLLLIRNELK